MTAANVRRIAQARAEMMFIAQSIAAPNVHPWTSWCASPWLWRQWTDARRYLQ